MACYKPLKGYRARFPNPSGKYSIVFNAREGFHDLPRELPCGQCIGCRLERSRQWAVRCLHEASLYSDNCFLTLTYKPEKLPKNGSLVVSDFQKFMKRLREEDRTFRNESELPARKVRFFHCGEYGEKYGRPHYHACVFNFDFMDKKLERRVNGNPYYSSKQLERLWPMGHAMIGEVTFESAAYVARYILKKITGKGSEEHYKSIGKIPEYVTMSRRPGIGKDWYEKYKSEVFPLDRVVVRGKECKPPKFYSSQYEVESPEGYEKLKARRQNKAEDRKDENSWRRLEVREICTVERLKLGSKRGYEDET